MRVVPKPGRSAGQVRSWVTGQTVIKQQTTWRGGEANKPESSCWFPEKKQYMKTAPITGRAALRQLGLSLHTNPMLRYGAEEYITTEPCGGVFQQRKRGNYPVPIQDPVVLDGADEIQTARVV